MVELKEIQKKLEKLERQINEDEKIKANLEGKREPILEKLKNEFGISEKEEIKKKLEEIEKGLNKISEEIEIELEDLENSFNWEEK